MEPLAKGNDMPGAETLIKETASSGRYEFALIVAVMLIVVGLLSWIVKLWITKASEREDKVLSQALERESRLSEKIDKFENFINTKFMEVVIENTKALLTISVQAGENTKALTELIQSMHTSRFCFASNEHQTRVIEVIADKVIREIVLKRQLEAKKE